MISLIDLFLYTLRQVGINLDLDLPFYGVIIAALTALVVMFIAWNKPEIKALMRGSGG